LPEKCEEWFAALKDLHLQTGVLGRSRKVCAACGVIDVRVGEALLEGMVFLGDSFPPSADREGRTDAQRHLANVLTYCDHPITNATTRAELEDSDGKKNAYGFRNRENMKIAIYFHCGGLNLYPQ